jgi:hypothetical protein
VYEALEPTIILPSLNRGDEAGMLEEGPMTRESIVVLASLFLVSCAGRELATTQIADPSAAIQAAAGPSGEIPAATAGAELEVTEVDLAQASGPADVVCTKVVRPGTRIVIGERCAPLDASGIDVRTREEIQREISGQGWSSGWKTADQIAAERRVMLGH